MHIILYHPQIPQNTGNIIRTCVATNTKLTLIEPIGFNTDTKSLRRAGLDYIKDFTIHTSDSLKKTLDTQQEIYFFSSRSSKRYDQVKYSANTTLIFGSEITGFEPWIHKKYSQKIVNIPISKKSRCLNLSNAVNIALYEALRQQDFKCLNP